MSQAAAAGQVRLPGRPAGALTGLGACLRAEWTKTRTVAGPGWLLAATAVLTVAVSAAVIAAVRCPAGMACPVDPGRLSLTGVQLGQAVVAILGVLTIGTEYSTGMMRTTLIATPRRSLVLAAKAAVLTGGVLLAGAAGVLGSVLAGRLIMPGHGFTAARGFVPLSLASGPVLRAAGGSVLYLALIALLSLGVAALVRDSAAAIGIVLGLLYLAPIAASFITNHHWRGRVERYSPMQAGLAIQATRHLAGLPISPWGGLGVLAAWAAAALLAGGLLLRLRDA
ncbi:MAG TPA: ABC transporter permease [Streptosporangiaceae bacterium]|jgi:ABC-2 type transport system permease protein|nr:ABC transporter permease [Streptosporangiaceae bacterium]